MTTHYRPRPVSTDHTAPPSGEPTILSDDDILDPVFLVSTDHCDYHKYLEGFLEKEWGGLLSLSVSDESIDESVDESASDEHSGPRCPNFELWNHRWNEEAINLRALTQKREEYENVFMHWMKGVSHWNEYSETDSSLTESALALYLLWVTSGADSSDWLLCSKNPYAVTSQNLFVSQIYLDPPTQSELDWQEEIDNRYYSDDGYDCDDHDDYDYYSSG